MDSIVKNQERNNEMKKDLGKKNWMFPMPVLMIGTYGADGGRSPRVLLRQGVDVNGLANVI